MTEEDPPRPRDPLPPPRDTCVLCRFCSAGVGAKTSLRGPRPGVEDDVDDNIDDDAVVTAAAAAAADVDDDACVSAVAAASVDGNLDGILPSLLSQSLPLQPGVAGSSCDAGSFAATRLARFCVSSCLSPPSEICE